MKVYTRTGDAGQTSLVGGTRVPKTHPRLEAYGTIDELNSHVGLLRGLLHDSPHEVLLKDIQTELFVLGSNLATDTAKQTLRASSVVGREKVEQLEHEIDKLDAALPAQRYFTLPGGCIAAAEAHICRTVCRRAERRILVLVEAGADIDGQLLAYMNRLSDYFYMLARTLNQESNCQENYWKP